MFLLRIQFVEVCSRESEGDPAAIGRVYITTECGAILSVSGYEQLPYHTLFTGVSHKLLN